MSDQRIVYVEDNADIQLLYGEYLRSAGYDVECSSHPEAALEIINNNPPDLIIMDVQLPDMDGIELTIRLKADPATAEIPVYILSSFAMDRDKERAAQAGCDLYLTKPISPALLLEHVRKFFAARESG